MDLDKYKPTLPYPERPKPPQRPAGVAETPTSVRAYADALEAHQAAVAAHKEELPL